MTHSEEKRKKGAMRKEKRGTKQKEKETRHKDGVKEGEREKEREIKETKIKARLTKVSTIVTAWSLYITNIFLRIFFILLILYLHTLSVRISNLMFK